MSNAFLNFSIKHKVQIEQKFFVKGHTQMECDIVHGLIEKKLKNKEIYLPSEFVRITKEARKNPEPYKAKMLSHENFNDFNSHQCCKSIRPEHTKGDPEVKDIRSLKYDPVKENIQYKLSFVDEYKD